MSARPSSKSQGGKNGLLPAASTSAKAVGGTGAPAAAEAAGGSGPTSAAAAQGARAVLLQGAPREPPRVRGAHHRREGRAFIGGAQGEAGERECPPHSGASLRTGNAPFSTQESSRHGRPLLCSPLCAERRRGARATCALQKTHTPHPWARAAV